MPARLIAALRCASQVSDISLEDYIAVKPKFAVYVPHTAGRYQKKRFRKAQCPIVERYARLWPLPLPHPQGHRLCARRDWLGDMRSRAMAFDQVRDITSAWPC